MAKKKILLIETGVHGGGSFESLYQHVLLLNEYYEFVVVFFNKTVYFERVRKTGIPVYLVRNIRYSKSVSRVLKTLAINLSNLLHDVFPKSHLLLSRLDNYFCNKRIAEIIRRESIEIVHLNTNPFRDFFFIYPCVKENVPVIAHLRSNLHFKWVDKFATEYINRHVKLFVSNSEATKKFSIDKGIGDPGIPVIYNVVNETPEPLPPDVQIKLEAFKSVFKLSIVGRIAKVKGFDFLIDVVLHLQKKLKDFVVVVVGKGDEEQHVRNKITELGLQAHFLFLGYLNNPLSVICSCEVMISTSEVESFGRVLAEAASVAKPIVATNVGGIPEIVEDGSNGYLVSYQDAPTFASRLLSLYHDRNLLKTMGENSRRHFDKKFRRENYISQFRDVYQLKSEVDKSFA